MLHLMAAHNAPLLKGSHKFWACFGNIILMVLHHLVIAGLPLFQRFLPNFIVCIGILTNAQIHVTVDVVDRVTAFIFLWVNLKK